MFQGPVLGRKDRCPSEIVQGCVWIKTLIHAHIKTATLREHLAPAAVAASAGTVDQFFRTA